MKKIFLFLLVLFLGTNFSKAQDETRDMSSIINSRVEDLTEMLTLTDDQVTQVRSIYEATLGEEGYTQESADERHDQIMDLLNADQQEIYSDYLENRSARSGRSRMDTESIIDNRVEFLTETLSLNEEQIAQVRTIYENTLGQEGNTQESSDQRHNEIMELLSTGQKQIYSDYLEEREDVFMNR